MWGERENFRKKEKKIIGAEISILFRESIATGLSIPFSPGKFGLNVFISNLIGDEGKVS